MTREFDGASNLYSSMYTMRKMKGTRKEYEQWSVAMITRVTDASATK